MKAAADYLPTSFWLMKTEPSVFSFEDLVRRKQEPWDGVRNYQARNFMRDHMRSGHRVLIYHSGIDQPAIVGAAEIVGEAVPDLSACDSKSPYHDPRATKAEPIWVKVTVGKPLAFANEVTLATIKSDPVLCDMLVARKGQRLSIQPVSQHEFEMILKRASV
jgi:predicted RNA-binding protein with PUA-like domain